MDLKISAAVAALEAAALLRYEDRLSAIRAWIGLVVFQYVMIKMYRIFIYPYFMSPLRRLPGPKNNQFLVGQWIRLMTAAGPDDVYREWVAKWPDAPFIRYLSFGNSEVLLVNNLAAHKACLQTHSYDFQKPRFYEDTVGSFLPGGLLFSNGNEHRRQRRLLAGPFSLAKLRKLVPVFQAKAREFIALLGSVVDDSKDGVVEVDKYLNKLALDIIGVTALGIELDQLKSSSSMNFHECYSAILDPSVLGALIMFLNPYIPIRWLPIEENRRFTKARTTIDRMIEDVVGNRAKEMANRGLTSGDAKAGGELKAAKKESRDLLTYMLEEELPEGGGSLTETQISQNLLQFMAAGHETTAGSLLFALYTLATRPDLQERLREEVLVAVADNPELDAFGIESLKFLNNFVRELARFYAPALAVHREAIKDMVIEGVSIAKGTTVLVVPGAMQRNPMIWGEDVNVFDPDRWGTLTGDAASPYAIEAFINGPRICIGKQQGILEIKVILTELVQGFVFEPVDTELKLVNPSLTLKPKGGMRVKFRRRLAV